MSLKAFHVVFLAASILLLLFLGYWGIHNYSESRNTMNLAMGVISLVSCGVLGWYGSWFLKKLKHLSYL